MKLSKPFLSIIAVSMCLFFTQTHLTSCQKEVIYDTLIVRDTITIRDTVCNCYDLKDGLVAYYNFNGGNLNDSSGYNNNIVFNNATKTTDRFGRADNAYLFNGTGSYMKVLNSASLNPDSLTIVATVKFDGFFSGLCKATQIVKKGFKDQDNGIYGLRSHDLTGDCSSPLDVSKQRIYGYYGNTQMNLASAADQDTYIKTGEWVNYVYTYDGKQSKIYVNGELKSVTTKTAPFTPNTDGLFIGRAENPLYPYYFNGAMDEIRIYKRALCEAEVKLLQDVKN